MVLEEGRAWAELVQEMGICKTKPCLHCSGCWGWEFGGPAPCGCHQADGGKALCLPLVRCCPWLHVKQRHALCCNRRGQVRPWIATRICARRPALDVLQISPLAAERQEQSRVLTGELCFYQALSSPCTSGPVSPRLHPLPPQAALTSSGCPSASPPAPSL